MHPTIKGVRVTLKRASEHWKDNAAGYHTWRVSYTMQDGRVITQTMTGTREDVKRVALENGPDLDEWN